MSTSNVITRAPRTPEPAQPSVASVHDLLNAAIADGPDDEPVTVLDSAFAAAKETADAPKPEKKRIGRPKMSDSE